MPVGAGDGNPRLIGYVAQFQQPGKTGSVCNWLTKCWKKVASHYSEILIAGNQSFGQKNLSFFRRASRLHILPLAPRAIHVWFFFNHRSADSGFQTRAKPMF